MALKTQYNYLKYYVILFRLFNILASFQNYINEILTKNLIFLLLYI